MKPFIIIIIISCMAITGLLAQETESATSLTRDKAMIQKKIESKEAKIIKGKQPTNADGWQHQRHIQRAGDDGEIPPNALLNAKKQVDNMPPADDAGIWDWTWLGPGNIGGRVRAILIHPETYDIWVGSVSGGIWKSTNNGASWAPVNDFLPNLAITSIVVDPVNTDIMYAATGESFIGGDAVPGAGIFKSTNGGQNWSQLAYTAYSDFKWVNRLSHHPDSSGVLYAAANSSGVWKTNDGGQTWDNIFVTASGATDIKVDQNNPSRILVGCFGDVYLSTDYGNSWSQINNDNPNRIPEDIGRCEVAFTRSQSKMYVSINNNKGEIWKSVDHGDTWQLMNTGTKYLGNQGWYNNTIWVDPYHSDHIIVGGIDLWKSWDGGQTLTKISDWHNYHNGGAANSAHADHHIIIEHPDFDPVDNPVVYFGNDGGIQMTPDVWETTETSGWVNLCNSTLGITQFYGGAANADASLIVGGTQDNDKLRYKKTGTWGGVSNWYQSSTGDGGCAAVNQDDNSIVYGEYPPLYISKSTNGGDSYVRADTGLADAGSYKTAFFVAPFKMDPSNSARLIAGGARIWETTNNASTWNEIKSDIGWCGIDTIYYKCSAIDISKSNGEVLWVGYEIGKVSKTENGGDDWIDVDENGPSNLPNRYVTDIAINPNNPAEVFVSFSGYYADNVWYTNDGGDNWENRSGTAPFNLPNIQVNTVTFHPTNTNWIYVGTDLGIFSSEDDGAHWNKNPYTGDHDGPANVEVAELFWAGDELIAATHGRGMYKTRPLDYVYVDKDAAPGGNGTFASPYQNLEDGVNAAGHGTNIFVFEGTYNDAPILLNKRGMIEPIDGSVIIQ